MSQVSDARRRPCYSREKLHRDSQRVPQGRLFFIDIKIDMKFDSMLIIVTTAGLHAFWRCRRLSPPNRIILLAFHSSLWPYLVSFPR